MFRKYGYKIGRVLSVISLELFGSSSYAIRTEEKDRSSLSLIQSTKIKHRLKLKGSWTYFYLF